jgi:hypothetical protein
MDAVVDSPGLFVIVIQTWASFGKISHILCHACMYDLSAKQTDTPAKKETKIPNPRFIAEVGSYTKPTNLTLSFLLRR